MTERRVAVIPQESDIGFSPNIFSFRAFGAVKVGDKEYPAALEKTGQHLKWVVEFFLHDSPWSTLKPGDDVTFSVGPKHSVKLKVGDHPTEIGVPDA